MRPPPDRVHDRLDAAEVLLVRHSLRHVDGDVAGLSPAGRRQWDVVARGEADLDREPDVQTAVLHVPAHPFHDADRRRSRDGVLHLAEVDPSGAGEHPVAPVDVLRASGAGSDVSKSRRPLRA